MPNADDLKATLGTTLKKSGKYRKYVWNDFSIVEKARIQILESGNFGTVPLNEDEFNLVDDLTVQINPEKFEYTHSIKPSSPLYGYRSGYAAPGRVRPSFVSEERSLGIPRLLFDIYDEYNARTLNGTIVESFSLMNDNVTSLPNLIQYAEEGKYYAYFCWGDIRKFGLLSGVSVEYTAFSPWGQPLKAEADVHITPEYLEKGKTPRIKGDISSPVDTVKNAGKKILNGVKNIFR